MILYHGTTSTHLEAILRDGLLARSVTGGESNWTGPIESKPQYVYLTDAYPVYFALAALKDDQDELLVVKVDVEETELYPDEDFIAYAACGGHGERSREMNASIDPADYQKNWRERLAMNGVVCTASVTPAQILDYRTISQKGRNRQN